MYNPQRNEMLILSIGLQSQHDDEPLFEGPLHMDVTFFMPIPSKTSKKAKQDIILQPDATRPDLDNLIKFVADISNGVLYKDDALIASISAKKVYDINPRTEFSIQSIKSGEKHAKKV
jgi:Holliday junction resolvase RusA-like endonuclease